jgi:hypothetical protein
MVSIERIRRRPLAAWALLLVSALAPLNVPAQSGPESPSKGDRQDQLTAKIAETEARYGPYSPQLIEAWTDIAQYYRGEGIHAREAAAISQAAQISRATYGLYSLEQVPLLQQLLRSHEELGDAAGVWDLERELMELAEKHPHDSRTASIWSGIADRRMAVLARYVAGEKPPELVLGCFYRYPSCTSGSRGTAIVGMFEDAQSKYENAVRELVRESPSQQHIDELRAVDTKIVASSYRYREHIGGYPAGARALQRLYAYDQISGEPAAAKAAALVRIADWNILFAANTDKTGWSPTDERPTKALAAYEQAYAFLQQDGATRAQFDELFAPPVPIVVPEFAPNPLVEQAEEGSTGFVDVAFDISKYGRSSDIRVLDTTSNASRAAKNRLARLIAASRFRPQVTNGHFDTAHVMVRYYVYEPPITTALVFPNVHSD